MLVATAHIHWDPEFCDVKLVQTMMLVDQLKRLTEDKPDEWLGPRTGKNNKGKIHMLLCGDFNSLPDSGEFVDFVRKKGTECSNHCHFSGVIEYLNEGRIRSDHLDFKDKEYKNTLTKMLSHSANEQYYTHGFRLKSVYDLEKMPYTNYTYDFKGMIDYIFYEEDVTRPMGYLGPISEDWLKENKVVGCPHPHITSG